MSREKQIEEMTRDLIKIFNDEYSKINLITAHNTAEKMFSKGYRNASEVAREIFAEIEDYMLGVQVDGFPALVINPNKYAELKKKYTESEKDNG